MLHIPRARFGLVCNPAACSINGLVRDPPDGRPTAKGPAIVGAVAQLGERLVCNQEVGGSIPLGSTKRKALRYNELRKA